jgi:acyl-CoA thioesterase
MPYSGQPPTDLIASATSAWSVADPSAGTPRARASSTESPGRKDASASSLEPGSFDRDTAVRRLHSQDSGAGHARRLSFAAEVSSDWRAGRGPHGGYLAAMLLRALTETVAQSTRAPRSLTIHYARAPKPGPVMIHNVLEREGRSLSTLSARMEQDGSLIALALAAFSAAWSAPEIAELQMPEVAGPEPVRETSQWLKERVSKGHAPQFLEQLVVQPRMGNPPFSGSQEPMEIGAWLGVRDGARPLDAIALALFSDALFSPPFIQLTQPATSPTVDLTIHFRTVLPRVQGRGPDPAQLCFARFRSALVHEGFFEEDGVIWAADGRPLAQSRQLAILMELPGSRMRGGG